MISSFESKMSRFEELQNATVNTPHNTCLVTTEINPTNGENEGSLGSSFFGKLGAKKSSTPLGAVRNFISHFASLALYVRFFLSHFLSSSLPLSLSHSLSLSLSLSLLFSQVHPHHTPPPPPPPWGLSHPSIAHPSSPETYQPDPTPYQRPPPLNPPVNFSAPYSYPTVVPPPPPPQ